MRARPPVPAALVPESRPFGGLINRRSAGIKDLRFGAVVDADWLGHEPDELLEDRCIEVPLLPGVEHHAVGATLTTDLRSVVATVLGDSLVRFPSAMGDGRRRRLAIAPNRRHHLGKAMHFDLLRHPQVYGWIRDSLGS